MTPRSFSILFNPSSGAGRASARAISVARGLREAGAEVEVTSSPGPSAVPQAVDRAIERGDVVVAAGGDGTISSVAAEVARRGGTLGLLPTGRGNDFCRALGVADDVESVVATLLRGRSRRVDLLETSTADEAVRSVVGSVCSGVDAHAAQIVAGVRRVPARLTYRYAAVRALLTFRPADLWFRVDGVDRAVRAATIVVANSPFYGAGMRIAPDADVADGLLDVIVVGAAGRWDLIRAVPSLDDGSHVHRPEVQTFRASKVEIGLRGADPVPVGGDGEPLEPLTGGSTRRVRVLPGALTVLT